MLGVIRSAAAVDPDSGRAVGADRDRLPRQPARDRRESIDAKGALRPGLDVDRATDILWTLNHPDVWLLLAGRGWTPEEFEGWFADATRSELLGPR